MVAGSEKLKLVKCTKRGGEMGWVNGGNAARARTLSRLSFHSPTRIVLREASTDKGDHGSQASLVQTEVESRSQQDSGQGSKLSKAMIELSLVGQKT